MSEPMWLTTDECEAGPGHEFVDAGGGLALCAFCGAEEWWEDLGPAFQDVRPQIVSDAL